MARKHGKRAKGNLSLVLATVAAATRTQVAHNGYWQILTRERKIQSLMMTVDNEC